MPSCNKVTYKCRHRSHGRSNVVPRIIQLSVLIFVTVYYGAFGRAESPMPVFVSINPQKYFVQRIGGNRVDVQVMVAPGASPITYEPRPRQMADLAKAKIYFAVGVPFEDAWLD